jgi:hypothetical protein
MSKDMIKILMMQGRGNAYEKWDICVVIYDTDIP